MFSSDMLLKEFKDMSKNVLYYAENNPGIIHPMGGTPIINSLFLCEYIIKKFKERHKCEKTIFVMLTDGGATDYIRDGGSYANQNVTIRDPNTGLNYSFSKGENAMHYIMNFIRIKTNITKTVGIYLTGSLNSAIIELLNPGNNKKSEYISEFTKKKYSILPKGPGFDKFFTVSINSFQLDNNNYLNNVNGYTSKNAVAQAIDKELTKTLNSLVFMKFFIDEIS